MWPACCHFSMLLLPCQSHPVQFGSQHPAFFTVLQIDPVFESIQVHMAVDPLDCAFIIILKSLPAPPFSSGLRLAHPILSDPQRIADKRLIP